MEGPTHLLYHVFPLAVAREVVEWNIGEIVSRRACFTGHKVVGVATGPTTLKFEEVRSKFPADWLVLEVENTKKLQEVNTWNMGWPHLERLDGQVFYCHAKGVTRWNRDYAQEAKLWTGMMYHTCLDFPQTVGTLLRSHPFVGSFKKVVKGFTPDSPSEWHYHGSFYWVRSDWFHCWRDILQVWFGTESFPGDVATDPKLGGSVFTPKKWPNNKLNLYNRTICQDTVAEMVEWEKFHQ